MRLKRTEKYSKPVAKGLLPTQQATISQVVCGMLFSRCLILAEIARGFETVVEFVHNLKRVFRYADNERLTEQHGKEIVAARIIHQVERRLRLKPGQLLEVIPAPGMTQAIHVSCPTLDLGHAPLQRWPAWSYVPSTQVASVEEQFLADRHLDSDVLGVSTW